MNTLELLRVDASRKLSNPRAFVEAGESDFRIPWTFRLPPCNRWAWLHLHGVAEIGLGAAFLTFCLVRGPALSTSCADALQLAVQCSTSCEAFSC